MNCQDGKRRSLRPKIVALGHAYLSGMPLAHTPTSVATPKDALARVCTQGYAVAGQQIEIGLRSLAVPVRNSADTVVAGINALVSVARLSFARMEARLLPFLREATEGLTPAFSR